MSNRGARTNEAGRVLNDPRQPSRESRRTYTTKAYEKCDEDKHASNRPPDVAAGDMIMKDFKGYPLYVGEFTSVDLAIGKRYPQLGFHHPKPSDPPPYLFLQCRSSDITAIDLDDQSLQYIVHRDIALKLVGGKEMENPVSYVSLFLLRTATTTTINILPLFISI